MSVKTGFILCAGLGTRMGLIGQCLPKPLWPIFEKTILDFVIAQMMDLGIEKIYINTHHCNEKFNNFVEEKYKNLITILYEDKLLGSGGAFHNLKRSYPNLSEVLVMNGDMLFLLTKEDLDKGMAICKRYGTCLFGMPVSPRQEYNLTLVKDGVLREILKKDDAGMAKIIDSKMTFSGVSLINLERIEYRAGVSSFFDSVANYRDNLVGFYFNPNINYEDLGTKDLYKKFIREITSNNFGDVSDEVKKRLLKGNFINLNLIGNNQYNSNKNGIFNFSKEKFDCTGYESDTFLFEKPNNCKGKGIYFQGVWDSN